MCYEFSRVLSCSSVHEIASSTGRLQWVLFGAHSSPGWISPVPSIFLHRRGAPALLSSSWPSSGPTPTALHPSCAGDSRPRCSTPDGALKGHSKGGYSSLTHYGHLSFDAAQDTDGYSGCKSTLLAHVQPFIHQNPKVFLCRTNFNEFYSQSVPMSGISSTQVHLAPGLIDSR